jgi:hypothetical protein
MANPEHLRILAQGLEAWNQWREQHGLALAYAVLTPRLMFMIIPH